jgi:rhodanese-related sulfurtransferase
MKNFILCSIAFLTLTSVAQAKGTFKTIKVDDLNVLIETKDAKLAIFDANDEKTRKEDGVIPGAKLLSSSSHYDTAKELPADKTSKLVFYCANTMCSASHAAAERALKSGYKDVNVMADGIKGWVKAGKPVTKI